MEWYENTVSNSSYSNWGYNYAQSSIYPINAYQDLSDETILSTDRQSWYDSTNGTPGMLFTGQDMKHKDIIYGDHWFSADQIILSQSDLSFYTNGEAWERDGVLYGQTNSPVYISTDLFIPSNVDYLSFDLKITEWNEGDIFALFINDVMLFSTLTDILNLDEWYAFRDFDISSWAGTEGTLTFGLIAALDGVHSQFAIRDINLYTTAPAPAPAPEPTTIVLLGLGLLGMAGVSRRKRNN